jgi:FK506-binding nuclear protein
MTTSRIALSFGLAVLLAGAACGSSGNSPGAGASGTPAPTYSSTPCNSPADKQPSGLIVQDLTCGTGPAAKTGDILTVNYTGKFENGKIFDTSKQAGRQPFPVQLGAGQVIKGWDIGLVGMHVGGTRRLTIPPSLGYGPKDYNGIPGGSTLIFDIDLLALQPGQG